MFTFWKTSVFQTFLLFFCSLSAQSVSLIKMSSLLAVMSWRLFFPINTRENLLTGLCSTLSRLISVEFNTRTLRLGVSLWPVSCDLFISIHVNGKLLQIWQMVFRKRGMGGERGRASEHDWENKRPRDCEERWRSGISTPSILCVRFCWICRMHGILSVCVCVLEGWWRVVLCVCVFVLYCGWPLPLEHMEKRECCWQSHVLKVKVIVGKEQGWGRESERPLLDWNQYFIWLWNCLFVFEKWERERAQYLLHLAFQRTRHDYIKGPGCLRAQCSLIFKSLLAVHYFEIEQQLFVSDMHARMHSAHLTAWP